MWLTDWTKFFEVITKPLPIASSLFLLVATSFLLRASDSTLTKLGLCKAVTEYRWAVGLGFIIAAAWILVTAIIWISRQGYLAWAAFLAKMKGRWRLHRCTADERRVLSGYVQNEVRSQVFHAAPDLGAAQALANDGILYRPDVMNDGAAVTYNIQEWALEYLSKNRRLIAPVVPAATRWSRAGNRELIKKRGPQIIAAIIGATITLLAVYARHRWWR
jgi:hypothetical protein